MDAPIATAGRSDPFTPPAAAHLPILVLHGIYGTGLLYDGLRAALEGSAGRVVAPDLQGHGANRHLTGPLDPEALADALIPALEAERIDRFHVIGHSHGGAAAQVLAHRHPERVASMVLVSSYTRQPLGWWERLGGRLAPTALALTPGALVPLAVRIARSGGGGRRLSTAAASGLARQMAANDARQMARAMRATRELDSRPWLDEIRVPTLVITGDRDRLVSPRQSALLAAGIPGARLEVVRRGGHIVPLSHPDQFHRLVADWLRDHPD